jgi:hypothetical protein
LTAALWVAGCGGVADLGGRSADCGCPNIGETQGAEAATGDAGASSDSSAPDEAEASVDGPSGDAATFATEAAADVAPADATQDAERGLSIDAAGSTDGPSDAVSVSDGPIDAPSFPADAPATCFDRIKDGDESDVDCGGSCAGCGPHKLCYGDFDCSATASGCDTASGGCFCQYVTHQCVYNHCYDGKVSADESDVDCGGLTCGPCANALACRQNSDCRSMACDGFLFVCDSWQCMDHKLDGMETDVDCGGGSCGPCQIGQRCNSSFDCQSGHPCLATHVCS